MMTVRYQVSPESEYLVKLVQQFAKEVTEAMVRLDTEVQKLKKEK